MINDYFMVSDISCDKDWIECILITVSDSFSLLKFKFMG